MKKENLIIVLLFSLFACTHVDKIENKISINVDNEDTIKYSSFIRSVSYIVLETQATCILGYIQRAIKDKGLIYILNNSASIQSIAIFDSTGKFQSKIDKQGRGPGEYLSITSFAVDKNDSAVFIYDQAGRDIKRYNLRGDLLNTFKVDMFGEDFVPLSDELFAFYSPIEPNISGNSVYPKGLYLLKHDGYLKTLLEIPKADKLQASGSFYFSGNGKETHFVSSFDDIIYSVKNDIVAPVFNLDFGKHSLNEELRSKKLEEISGDFVVTKFNPVETVDYLFTYLMISNSRRPQLLIINKGDGTGKAYNHILNDIDSVPSVFVASTESELISIVNPLEIMKLKEKRHLKGIPSVTADNNPLIQVFHVGGK